MIFTMDVMAAVVSEGDINTITAPFSTCASMGCQQLLALHVGLFIF
jgi:hypothetical protein